MDTCTVRGGTWSRLGQGLVIGKRRRLQRSGCGYGDACLWYLVAIIVVTLLGCSAAHSGTVPVSLVSRVSMPRSHRRSHNRFPLDGLPSRGPHSAAEMSDQGNMWPRGAGTCTLAVVCWNRAGKRGHCVRRESGEESQRAERRYAAAAMISGAAHGVHFLLHLQVRNRHSCRPPTRLGRRLSSSSAVL